MRAAGGIAAALATALLAGCATPKAPPESVWLETVEGQPTHRFVARGQGWYATPWPARFPLRDATPPLPAMTGAATARPFACGVDPIKGNYFVPSHGPLICAQGAPDGAIHVGPVGRVDYSEAFDALEHSDWRIVVARRAGATDAEALIQTTAGWRAVPLSGAKHPRAAVVLDPSRVAVLQDSDESACRWTVFEIDGARSRIASTSPGPACNASQQFQLLRDQVSDKPYLLASINLSDHALHFLDAIDGTGEAGARQPLTFSGPAHAPVIHEGTLYYDAALDPDRRQLVGSWNLTSREERRHAFPGPTGPAMSTPHFFAFVIPQRPGEPLGILISDERGRLQLRSLNDASPVS